MKYIVKRILQAIPLLLIITFICFMLINLAPYDAIDSITTPDMTKQEAVPSSQPPAVDSEQK